MELSVSLKKISLPCFHCYLCVRVCMFVCTSWYILSCILKVHWKARRLCFLHLNRQPFLIPLGFPDGSGVSEGKRICLQFRIPQYNPRVKNIPWRRQWLPTTVFWPGEFHGQKSLAGYSPWGHEEVDTTTQLTFLLFWIPCLSIPCLFLNFCWKSSAVPLWFTFCKECVSGLWLGS